MSTASKTSFLLFLFIHRYLHTHIYIYTYIYVHILAPQIVFLFVPSILTLPFSIDVALPLFISLSDSVHCPLSLWLTHVTIRGSSGDLHWSHDNFNQYPGSKILKYTVKHICKFDLNAPLKQFNGLVQDSSISIANAMEMLPSCTKPPTSTVHVIP